MFKFRIKEWLYERVLSVYFVWVNHITDTLDKESTSKTIEIKEQIVVTLEKEKKRQCRKFCGVISIKEGIEQKDEPDGS